MAGSEGETTTKRQSSALNWGMCTAAVQALYVLSIGPGAWLWQKSPPMSNTRLGIEIAFRPITWLSERCTPVQKAVWWYMEFWAQQEINSSS